MSGERRVVRPVARNVGQVGLVMRGGDLVMRVGIEFGATVRDRTPNLQFLSPTMHARCGSDAAEHQQGRARQRRPVVAGPGYIRRVAAGAGRDEAAGPPLAAATR